MKIKIIAILLFVLTHLFLNTKDAKAQCCDTSLVRTFIIDLSSNPDSVWISPDVTRNGLCCGATGEQCIQFIIYTHPASNQVAFGVASPPDPPGQFFSIACADSAHMGQPVCINGGDSVCIVYCKGGNDASEYAVTVTSTIAASPDIYVSDGCTAEIWAKGFQGYVEWNSIAPGTYGQYNSYLDCQTCDTTGVTPSAGYPPFIDYEVSGDVFTPCTMLDLVDTVRVYFVDEKFLQIIPDTPAVCFGGSDIMITAVPTGGAPPYIYKWNTGDSTQSITVGGGTYWVEVTDSTDCPPIYDTVTVLEFSIPINADAGLDQTPCVGTTNVILDGTVDIATGGIWSGGAGFFSDNTNLNATYSPTLSEISNGSFSLTLITTGNWTCPADTDIVNFVYLPDLTVDAGPDKLVCQGETSVALNATVSNGVSSGIWHTPNGTGSFFPNDTSINTFYLPTAIDTANGTVSIVFSSDGTFDCTPKLDTLILFFGIKPTADFVLPTACNLDSINFIESSLGAVTWLWDFDNSNSSTLQSPPNQLYNLYGEYEITLTVTDSIGCMDTKTDTLHVHDTPNVNIYNDIICENQIASFVDISSISNDTIISWFWDFDNSSTSSLQNPSMVFDTAGTYNVSLTISTPYCTNTDTLPIVVNPLPIIDIQTSSTQGCNYSDIIFTNNTTGANSYSWSFGDGVTSTLTSPSHVFTNNTNFDTTFVVTFIAYTANACSDTSVFPIVIYPTPKPVMEIGSSVGCSPLDVTIVNSTTGAGSYFWDFGDGTTSTAISPSHTYVNNNSYVVSYNLILTATSPYGCTDSINNFVTVYPNPGANFLLNSDTSCNPANMTLVATPSQYSYEWIYGDGISEFAGDNVNHTYYNYSVNDTSYDITLITTTIFGCTDTIEQTLVVRATPVADFIVDTLSGCTDLTINILNQSIGATSYTWDFGDGNTGIILSNNFLHTYVNTSFVPISYIIELTASNSKGCSNSENKTITVYPSPNTSFTVVDSVGCSPLVVDFSNTSIGSNQYFWDFGDGQISTNTNPLNTFVNQITVDTTYTVVLSSSSIYNCVDSTIKTIVVHPQPESLFGLNSSAGCAPFTVDMTNNSNGSINHYWYFGDGDSLSSNNNLINHTYDNTTGFPLDFQIDLVAENTYGCFDTVMQTISVFPVVFANFIADTMGCSPFLANFINQSLGATTYEWNFGDGSSSNNFNTSHSYVNLNATSILTNTATLVVTSNYNCKDSLSVDIDILPVPNAVFAINNIVGCSPFNAIIDNNTIGGSSFIWDFGDGTNSTSSDTLLTHVFENFSGNVTTYDIELTVSNIYNCTNSTSNIITIYPDITAEFTPEAEGCSPLIVSFTNLSQGEETSFWDFGDGATSGEPHADHTFTNYGINNVNYNVTLLIESEFGCLDSFVNVVTVYATPLAEFTATPTYQMYPNSIVTINNLTQGTWVYDWNFNNEYTTNDVQPGTYDFQTWGEFDVTLIAQAQNCSDTLTHSIIIDAPPPIGKFEGDASGCPPLTVNFANSSLYATFYNWDFGDGGTSNQEEPSYTFYNSGTFVVTLKVEGPGGDDLAEDRTIVVYKNPIAIFKAIPAYVVVPNEEVTFYNLSEYASIYYWDFGDGTTSTEEQPIHKYTSEGVYDISLFIESINGCKDTIYLDNAVIAESSCDVIFPNAFSPAGNNRAENGLFKPIFKGLKEYQLEVFNQWGELMYVSNEPDEGWDGYHKGVLSKLDVYVWRASWTCVNGEAFVKVGDVTLIR